jgi:hypothetical protein
MLSLSRIIIFALILAVCLLVFLIVFGNDHTRQIAFFSGAIFGGIITSSKIIYEIWEKEHERHKKESDKKEIVVANLLCEKAHAAAWRNIYVGMTTGVR